MGTLLIGLGLLTLNGAPVVTKDFFVFHRTYVVGGTDTYAVTFTDSTRNDGPFSETMIDTVTAVNNGVATMNVVTSNGHHNPKGHNLSTTEFNSQMQTTFGASGFPAIPSFPSLNVRDALFLAMQGLTSVDKRGGVSTVFPAVTAPGSGHATFTGQSAFLAPHNAADFNFLVNGVVNTTNGALPEQLRCTFKILDNAVVREAKLTITQGTQTVTANFVRTGP